MSDLEEKLGGTQPDESTSQPGSLAPGEGLPPSTPAAYESEAELYGYVAEFEDEHELLHAAQRARQAGFRHIDAYSPIPVEGLSEAIGFRRSFIPLLMLAGGIGGLLAGLGLQYWSLVLNYPINIGGRPLNSMPMFVPIAFETTILFASFAGIIGMFVLNGLPAPYHPLFNVAAFARASQDRFFLAIDATDRLFRPGQTREFLKGLNPVAVHEVYP
jgi:hypothetical protein